ncbi:MAG: DNA double-strand break repair nuclease NurA [Methanomicrobiales archaeon]|nr:DNA double-strand break repair nuclease NurA [Methanomicrobiales archaeon]
MKVPDPEYDHELHITAGLIRATIPANLIEGFSQVSGISERDFQNCSPTSSGEISAIDGSHFIMLESGSTALAILRAAQTTYWDMKRFRRSLTPLKFALIGPETENQIFPELYRSCFGQVPGTPLANDDKSRAAAILRDTLEYWVTEQMATELNTGALLLRDGPLRVSHASHDPVLIRIVDTCKERDIDLVGVSKRTTSTWGGGHPLLLSVGGLAKSLQIRPPWWIRINPSILDRSQFPQWQHGQMFIVCLHPRAKSPLKVELPRDLPLVQIEEIMNRLVSCSGDGRIPGYPFPLFDAHRTVTLTKEVVDQVRNDLVTGLVESGLDRQTYDILFGDYHNEFARY